MIKVESNMLVLDSTFSKEDAEAITYFVNIAKAEERKRIMDKLEFYSNQLGTYNTGNSKEFKTAIDTAILFIKEETDANL